MYQASMVRKCMDCLQPIEHVYYNLAHKGSTRHLHLRDICGFCGKMESSDFIFRLKELSKINMSGEFSCLSICKDCMGRGKDPVHKGGGV